MNPSFTRKIIGHLPRLERKQIEQYLLRATRQEQFLRKILDTMTEGVIAGNRDNVVVFANAGVYDLIGVTSEEITGAPLVESLRDDALREAIANTDFNAYVTLEVNVKYPRALTLMAQVVPLPNNTETQVTAEKPVYLLLLRDVSYERTRSSARERKSRLEVMRLLTAGVAHEIGNPLSAIILHTQLMDRALKRVSEGREADELVRINRVIHEESNRLKRIVGDFLNAVRPLSLKLQFGQLADSVEDTFELLYSELNDNDVAVVKDISDAPETLFDADQLRSVIINIVRNAMDAMPDGGTLTVSLKSRGDWLELSFNDDGCGIEAAGLAHVFEPFYTTKADGSGLGLLIVQRIMNAHNGAVRIHSRPGGGTTVTLDLPVRVTAGKKSLPQPRKKKT